MDLDPMSYAITLPVDTVFTDTLNIINDGAGELTWEIHETTATMPLRLERQQVVIGDMPFSYDPNGRAGINWNPGANLAPLAPDAISITHGSSAFTTAIPFEPMD